MDKHLPPISIEDFAAYLDGNLSMQEANRITDLAQEDESIKRLLDANDVINKTLSSYSGKDLELPQEIESLSFELPNLHDDNLRFVGLSPESASYIDFAAAACADTDFNIDDIDNNIVDLRKATEPEDDILLTHEDGNIIDPDLTSNNIEDY